MGDPQSTPMGLERRPVVGKAAFVHPLLACSRTGHTSRFLLQTVSRIYLHQTAVSEELQGSTLMLPEKEKCGIQGCLFPSPILKMAHLYVRYL